MDSLLQHMYNRKIGSTESATSSISCAQQYFEDAGTGEARYDRIDVMIWAHQQGYSQVWEGRRMWGILLVQTNVKNSQIWTS
mmetsp:Transcript_11275/g.16903  ORF Transcript_11275/g.16903 Transcript_11275/m.16903 type:complete len:82 (+) Transcript_11275:257-502(+)